MIIGEVRDGITAITATAANWGDGIADLLMGDVRRCDEVQVWFLAETFVDTSPRTASAPERSTGRGSVRGTAAGTVRESMG